MTPKKREAAVKRIADIQIKMSELDKEMTELQKAIEADDKERLLVAARKTGMPIDHVINLLENEKEEKTDEKKSAV